jgi:hypothetical protein
MSLNRDQLALENNLMVLSNVTELAASVVTRIAGNNAANTLEGKPVSPAQLRQAVAARVQSALLPYLKG